MRREGHRSRRRAAGLTLIELMIAVTVALIILAALAVMYGTSVKARNQIERVSRQIENGRYAIQLLRADIQLAGFFGEAFGIRLPDGSAAASACVAFGIERWTLAFLAAHGTDARHWPALPSHLTHEAMP